MASMSTAAAFAPSIHLDAPLAAKLDRLHAILHDLGRVVVAYSGGVDSTFLAKSAFDALGDNARAVTAVSGSLAEHERHDAERYARAIGIRHELIATHELDNPAYRRNDAFRCFHCKAELFDRLQAYADEHAIPHMVYGPVVDDLGTSVRVWTPAAGAAPARRSWKPAFGKPRCGRFRGGLSSRVGTNRPWPAWRHASPTEPK